MISSKSLYQALNDVGNIVGEHLLTWDNEATMIEKIAKDVLDKLNFTPSRDFYGMVGLEAHLRKMQNLLDLDNDGVKVVAITGPAGIGKTTIARALHSQLSSMFQLTCFVDNLRGYHHSGFDEYGYKLQLQEHFLSKVLNHNGMRICHLGAVKENLSEQRVLITLDDVNNFKQLEALVNEATWFGSGSRIVVTTENQELLQQHGIDNICHVEFPSDEEALKILCRYAFRQPSPRHGFKELVKSVTELCGNLPLALRVVGSSLHGKKEDEWEDVMNRLENILDRDIEDVLRVGYESLDENEQTLFQHIAVFFNFEDRDLLKAMFADGNLDVKRGLKILVNRSLVDMSRFGKHIVMHKLLQKMAWQTWKYERDTLTWKHNNWLHTDEGSGFYRHYMSLLFETVPATLTKQQKSIGQPMGDPPGDLSRDFSLGELFWFHFFSVLPDRLRSSFEANSINKNVTPKGKGKRKRVTSSSEETDFDLVSDK